MKRKVFTHSAILLPLATIMLAQTPTSFSKETNPTTRAAMPRAASVIATPAAVEFMQSSNIGVNGFYSVNKAQRGRTIQAAIVLDIPNGYHVNANKPLGKYAVPTTIKIEAPRGIRVSAISFPRAVVRRPKFSQGEPLAFYEGRAVLRFNVTVPANYEQGVTELRAKVRFQSCTDEVCYPPATRDLALSIGIVGANDSVQRINGEIFGGGGSSRGRRR